MLHALLHVLHVLLDKQLDVFLVLMEPISMQIVILVVNVLLLVILVSLEAQLLAQVVPLELFSAMEHVLVVVLMDVDPALMQPLVMNVLMVTH